jgi:hypothetical protein
MRGPAGGLARHLTSAATPFSAFRLLLSPGSSAHGPEVALVLPSKHDRRPRWYRESRRRRRSLLKHGWLSRSGGSATLTLGWARPNSTSARVWWATVCCVRLPGPFERIRNPGVEDRAQCQTKLPNRLQSRRLGGRDEALETAATVRGTCMGHITRPGDINSRKRLIIIDLVSLGRASGPSRESGNADVVDRARRGAQVHTQLLGEAAIRAGALQYRLLNRLLARRSLCRTPAVRYRSLCGPRGRR